MKRITQIAICSIICLTCNCGNNGIEADDNDVTAPSVPGGIVLSEAGTDFLSFIWEKADNADSYAWKLLKGMTLVKDGSCTECSVTVDGLESGCGYSFAVRSCKGGQGVFLLSSP